MAPTTGEPTSVTQWKILLVVDPVLKTNNKLASAQEDPNILPAKKNYNLYHYGKGENDNVSYGYDTEKNIAKLIAFDLGGLTNLRLT